MFSHKIESNTQYSTNPHLERERERERGKSAGIVARLIVDLVYFKERNVWPLCVLMLMSRPIMNTTTIFLSRSLLTTKCGTLNNANVYIIYGCTMFIVCVCLCLFVCVWFFIIVSVF